MLGATRTTEGGSGSKQSPRRLRRVRRTRRPLPATVGQGEGKLQNAPRPRVDHAQVNPSGVRAACRTISRRMLVQRRVSVKEPYPPRIPHHRHSRGRRPLHNRHSGLEPESRSREPRLDDTAWTRDVAALRELCKGLRRRESTAGGRRWVPVCTGTTEGGGAPTSSFPRRETFEQPSFPRRRESRNRESRLDDTVWTRDVAALGELCKGLRRRESTAGGRRWVPVCTGTTEGGGAPTSSFPRTETFAQPSFRPRAGIQMSRAQAR